MGESGIRTPRRDGLKFEREIEPPDFQACDILPTKSRWIPPPRVGRKLPGIAGRANARKTDQAQQIG